jgi:ABC-2 type transport system permease protein
MFQGATSTEFVMATNSSDYFSFVLIGSIFYVYIVSSLFGLGRAMFWERAQGTIEALFLSPINHVAYMTGIAIASFVTSTVDVLLLFSLGTVLGFRVQHIDALLLTGGVCLMILALFGLGLIVNAITLTFRDRVNTANTLMTVLLVFSGIVCPIALMPEWAQILSKIVPFTYDLDILRSALIYRSDIANILTNTMNITLLASLYIIIGIILLKRIERNSRKKALLTVL